LCSRVIIKMTIHILPDVLIAQIAAGEVVERPASVIKELLENALDAEATAIHIEVKNGGRSLIRISDNGTGIPADEVKLAFARHATSKLSTIEDLDRLLTLGFRGEALSSIASVSRLTITTRYRNEEMGTQLKIDGGNIISQQAIGAPSGTVISVENLFFNTPARLKFLKTDQTEKRHITHLITRYAMAYPQVRFTLVQDGREMLHTTGSGELADVILQVVGLDQFKQMIPVDLQSIDETKINVHGYVSMPSLYRADRGQITLFINGRWITDSKLVYSVVQAYHGLLKDARYPIAVLMVTMPPHDVDVNVHPTKAEVRFRDNQAVFATVQRGVRTALISSGERPSFTNRITDMPQGGWYERATQTQMPFEVEDTPTAKQTMRLPSEEEIAIPAGMGQPIRPRTLPLLRVVGQVGATYIVAEGPAGLYLIDQHASHQRLLYEDLIEQNFDRLVLDTPQTINLSAKQAQIIEKYHNHFDAYGIDIAPFGGNSFQLRTIPEPLSHLDWLEVMSVIADNLTANNPDEAILLRLSQYGAIKSGQTLNHEDMQIIVRRLERAREPLVDPFGRPTLIHMTGDQLARQFGR
jgi:DNA mismatch repair protein MutL